MSDNGDVQPEVPSVGSGAMTVESALQEVLKKALINDSLARGIREVAKALDRGQARLCVLAESCDEKAYTKLIEALCKANNIPLIKVGDKKKLGEWAGLCKIDREGNPRKVVAASSVAVIDIGEESPAMQFLEEQMA